MSKPLDELYFTWLYSQVGPVRHRHSSTTYWTLLRQLYTKEFVWIIPNDDNRVEDGKDLRYEFLDAKRIEDVDPEWMLLGCSMFEMMIALSRIMSFEADGKPSNWFWEMMANLNLDRYNDEAGIPEQKVDSILDRVIWRTFRQNGHGGLFPLNKANEDQREIEIWRQLSAYILERGYV